MNVALDLATYIAQKFAELVLGTNLFVGFEPAYPDNCVTVYPIMSDVNEYTLDGTVFMKNRIQIRVRNIVHSNGLQLINDIADNVSMVGPIIINGTKYQLIQRIGNVYNIGVDEKMRTVFIVNCDMVI